MLGNFSYCNATKLYFGEDSLKFLNEELPKYGKNVQLIYGGGSIKKNGIYDAVVEILKANGKNIIEDSGVMPNPTVEKLYEGVKIARENDVDLLLAVGGGSCCDYAKAVSVSINCDDDPWQKYFIRFEEPTCKIVPVGCVLTMVGTGSEMNGGSVISNHKENLKIGHVLVKKLCRNSPFLIQNSPLLFLKNKWWQGFMTYLTISASSIFQEKMTIQAIILQKL